MSLIDYIKGEFVRGQVVDKYKLPNGNIGIVVQQKGTYKRYHVEFKDDRQKPALENLYGLLSYPFSGKTEHVDRLVNKGDAIDVAVSYNRTPFRKAYRIYSTSRPRPYKNPGKIVNLPYRPVKMNRY